MFMYYNFISLIEKLDQQTQPQGVQSSKMGSMSSKIRK